MSKADWRGVSGGKSNGRRYCCSDKHDNVSDEHDLVSGIYSSGGCSSRSSSSSNNNNNKTTM